MIHLARRHKAVLLKMLRLGPEYLHTDGLENAR